MDTEDIEFAAIKEKQRLKRLAQQIQDMFPNVNYKQLVKELDYNMYSGPEKIEVVQILCRIESK